MPDRNECWCNPPQQTMLFMWLLEVGLQPVRPKHHVKWLDLIAPYQTSKCFTLLSFTHPYTHLHTDGGMLAPLIPSSSVTCHETWNGGSNPE